MARQLALPRVSHSETSSPCLCEWSVKFFKGINEKDFVYFVHSYFPQPISYDAVLAVTDYEGEFACAVGKDNYIGTQFHPEKSAQVGLRLLANFAAWDGQC